MESAEIQLFSNVFDINKLTSQEIRNDLLLSINQIDVNRLTDLEIRQSFNGIKVALGVFICKFVELETQVTDIKSQQLAYETKMEAMFLKSREEIKELKDELKQIRNTDRQLKKVVKVAEILKDNDYAPMAIKSMMKGISEGDVMKDYSFPEDFNERLEWAKTQGFKWNKNNRPPAKPLKKIEILEKWEIGFYKARSLSRDSLINRELVMSLGKGGPAGALQAIEEILGYKVKERGYLTVFNCYQKAVKQLMGDEEDANTSKDPGNSNDFDNLINTIFTDIDLPTYQKIKNGLDKLPRPLNEDSILSQLKIYFSIDLIPSFIVLEEVANPLTLLPKLQGNNYDVLLRGIINKEFFQVS